jgi:hypothetical protein
MEISQKTTRNKKSQPKYVVDDRFINTDIELLLKHNKHKFVHIRTELKDYGHIYKLTLYIDSLAFKEWIINKTTKVITKTLDHFG